MSAIPKDHPTDNHKGKIALYSPQYFVSCAIGGAIACGPTHTLMVPIDLVKCNSQTDPEHFSKGSIKALRAIYSGELQQLGFNRGFRGLVKGWGPTFIGYSLQGLGKYGGYELFAYQYSQLVGSQTADKYRPLIWMSASATAEFFADLFLCPFEAVKVRIQTNPRYAVGVTDGIQKMIKTEGFSTLYSGLIPLWARQIPYTVIKFVSFEAIAEEIYKKLPKKKEEMSKIEQLGVVFSAGYLAGILCATASHPADVLVSKINQVKTEGSFFKKAKIIIYGDTQSTTATVTTTATNDKPVIPRQGIGMKGLWVGLLPRIVMIGTLTGLQWLIYGAFKSQVGLPTPGGH